MIWKEYLNNIAEELTEHLIKDTQYSGIPKGQVRQIVWREMEVFVEDYKRWPPEKLIFMENTALSRNDRFGLDNFLKARIQGKPLAHIIGKQRFYGIDFQVNNKVLIPRPETEELVSYALKCVSNNSILVDVGTGSGCILAAILNNLSKNIELASIYAIDKSKSALRLAKNNIGTKFKINYLFISLFPAKLSKITNKKMVIVANLPYLSVKKYQQLSPEVKKYEPRNALVGGREGHELILKLINQVLKIRTNCEMLLEISPTIFPEIKKHLVAQDVKYRVKLDLSGKIRILHIKLSSRNRKY